MRSTREVLKDPGSYGATLLAVLFDKYGAEFINWDPESLEMQLRADFGFIPDEYSMDRIQAACALLTTNLFHLSIEGFCNICSALNFGQADGDMFVPCDLEDVIWGVTEARLIEGSQESDEQGFSHDIALYTGLLLENEGITNPPSILQYAEYDPASLDERDLVLSGDSFMAEVYEEKEAEQKAELEQFATAGLHRLVAQLSNIQFENGDTSEVKQILKRMRGA